MSTTLQTCFIFDPPISTISSHNKFDMCRILLQSKKNLLHLTTMAEQSLQSMFHQVFVTQRFIQQLSSAEDMIIDVSDYLDEQEVPHEDTFSKSVPRFVNYRPISSFILAAQLLDVCRAIENFIRTYGRLPQLSLDFA